MVDEVDRTDERMQREAELFEAEARRQAALIPKGAPGECNYCGEDFARVVEVEDPSSGDTVKACGFCRDKRKLN